nr:hypothetical protein CFP56_10735 [Quercus suber]
MEAVAWTFRPLWKTKENFNITNAGNNVLLFALELEVDVEKVLLREPWSFDCHLVLFQRFDGSKPSKDLDFKLCSFWVQIHDLPYQFLTPKAAVEITETIGPVTVSRDTAEMKGGADFEALLKDIDNEILGNRQCTNTVVKEIASHPNGEDTDIAMDSQEKIKEDSKIGVGGDLEKGTEFNGFQMGCHNPIPKTTAKETETNKAEGTSKSTKKKSPTSKNNVKENDNQTSGAQVNTGATVRSQENPTPQVYHISLESVLESFGLLCTHGHDGASTSSSGRGSEDDYAFTVVWEYDPNLGQRGSNNSKSKKSTQLKSRVKEKRVPACL